MDNDSDFRVDWGPGPEFLADLDRRIKDLEMMPREEFLRKYCPTDEQALQARAEVVAEALRVTRRVCLAPSNEDNGISLKQIANWVASGSVRIDCGTPDMTMEEIFMPIETISKEEFRRRYPNPDRDITKVTPKSS